MINFSIGESVPTKPLVMIGNFDHGLVSISSTIDWIIDDSDFLWRRLNNNYTVVSMSQKMQREGGRKKNIGNSTYLVKQI